ncbi:MAG: response regulator [Acidobacteriota bacterium]|nr:response regulator [Acidobacteriota bacterium]
MKTEVSPAARILLVDDNHHGIAARKTILQELGYSVESALSGEDAWIMLQASPFDLVVTDFRMGGMDGIELIRLIRGSDSKAKLVLLSGFAGCLGITPESSGADEVLTKSNKEAQELVRVVKKLLTEPPRRRPASSERAPARKIDRAV